MVIHKSFFEEGRTALHPSWDGLRMPPFLVESVFNGLDFHHDLDWSLGQEVQQALKNA